MKILHVGGTGFLGSRIASKLLKRGHHVHIVTRNPGKHPLFDSENCIPIEGDIRKAHLIKLDESYDAVLYTAMVPFKPGRISRKQFQALEKITREYFEGVVALTKNLACPLILTGGASFETKGDGIANEAWRITRKGMAGLGRCYDEIVERVKTEECIPLIEMLPAQIYGSGGAFDKMINMAKKGKLVILGSGNNYMPRVHVEDCANAYVQVLEYLPVGERFIICDDEAVRVEDFMKFMASVFEVKKVRKIPKMILRIVVGKYVYETLCMNSKLSNKKAKTVLNWELKYPDYRKGLESLVSAD